MKHNPLVLALAAVSMTLAGGASAVAAPRASAAIELPRIEGPVTGGTRGFPYSASIVDLDPYGYAEAEYFVSGNAHAFTPAPGTTLGADGRWRVVPGVAQRYKTRLLVRKPPKAKFNGTVIVEFMQEYYGSERDTNYRWNAETILRKGFGWVGVSLHHEGIDDPSTPKTIKYGGRDIPLGTTLARWDKARYGSLTVPTSDMSYDILSQVGRAVGPRRAFAGVDPFAGLKVRKVLAVGNTIAGERLAIYINAVQPLSRAFDGFFLQDFTPGAKLKLAQGVETTNGVLRTDVAVPVIVLDTTTAAAKMGPRPEGQKLRYWHPAGSSHTTGAYMVRVGKANQRDFGMDGGFCPVEKANSLPVQYVSGAALVALDRWAKGATPAPTFPQLAKFDGPAKPDPQPASYFDAHGNVKGGLRTPWVDAPIARYDWRGDCIAGSGSSFAFTTDQLKALYGTPATYRARFAAAARRAVERGVLLPEDADTAIAEAAKVRW